MKKRIVSIVLILSLCILFTSTTSANVYVMPKINSYPWNFVTKGDLELSLIAPPIRHTPRLRTGCFGIYYHVSTNYLMTPY